MRKFMLCWILLLSLLLAACQPAGPGSSDPTVDVTDPIASCDHSYEETVIEPTQYDDGARVYTCIHCGHTYEKVLYATGSQGLQMHLLGNGTYAVNGIGSCTDTNVVIPAYYQGHMVTKIMGFGGNKNITSIRIPATVSTIESSVFRQCSNLKEIHIPFSVARMGQQIFAGCDSLETVYYGTNFEFSNQYRKSPLAIESLKKVVFGGTHVPVEICKGAVNLEEVVLQEGVTIFSFYSFAGCAKLRSIEIPLSVTTISGGSLLNFDSLTELRYAGTVAQWEAIEKRGVEGNLLNCKVICTDGEGTIRDTAPDTCEHTFENRVTVEPGCEIRGITVPVCTLCGANNGEEIIEPLGHDWISGTCSRCGQEEQSFRPLTTGQWILAGTTEDGRELEIITVKFHEDYTCTLSAEYVPHTTWEEARKQEALGNGSILEFEGEPYLMTGGYTYSTDYTCSASGDLLRLEPSKTMYGIQTDLGHDALYLRRVGRQLILDAPCGMFIDPTFTYVLNRAGVFSCLHNYEGTVLQAATCQEAGLWEFTCTICHDTYNQNTDPKHSYENGACIHCGSAAQYHKLSDGTWISHRASGDGLGLSVLDLTQTRTGRWSYDLNVVSYIRNTEEFFDRYAPFSMHLCEHDGLIYHAVFPTTFSYGANITEEGDTVTIEIGSVVIEGVYHTYTTIQLQRLSGNQYVVTQGDDWGGILFAGELLTFRD